MILKEIRPININLNIKTNKSCLPLNLYILYNVYKQAIYLQGIGKFINETASWHEVIISG